MDVEFPRREREYVDLARIDQALAGRRARLADRQSRASTKATRCLPAPRIVSTRMSLESDRSFDDLRQRARPCHGPAAAGGHDDLLGAGHPRRAARVSDPVGSFVFLDPCRVRPARADGHHRAPFPAARRRRARLRARRRRRAGAGSIRDGTRRPRASSCSASCTSSKAPTTCCSCCCLIIPFRRVRTLIPIVTAFTVAHSITLIASAYNYAPDALWFPPLIETLIAMSIFYMALENIVSCSPAGALDHHLRCSGSCTGSASPSCLEHTLQFAGSHLLTSLLAFNVGVELGQLLVLVLLVPAAQSPLQACRRRAHGHDHPLGDRRPHRRGTG